MYVCMYIIHTHDINIYIIHMHVHIYIFSSGQINIKGIMEGAKARTNEHLL